MSPVNVVSRVRRAIAPLCLSTSLFPAGTLQAQVQAQGAGAGLVGERVRLHPEGGGAAVIGRVLAIDSDTMAVEAAADEREAARPLRIALADVESLEISTGASRRAGKGARIGAITGFAIGAVLGAIGGATDDDDFLDISPVEGAALAGGVLGAAGALAGVVIGALTVREDWREVPTERWRITYDPRQGFAVGLRVGL